MLSAAEALERVLAIAQALPEERVPLHAACGRVLAEDVVAPAPLPPADTSAMDGYAVRADECRGPGPYRLPVVGESRAGEPFAERLSGGACRIFTGAWLPDGADAVVLQEDVEREASSVVFRERPEAMQNVRQRGEDIAAGAQVLRAGTRLNPFHVGLLASVEHSEVQVARRPRVGILATGSELRPPGSEAVPGSIAESNTFAIAALARRAGAETRVGDRLPDELAATEAAIGALLEDCDLLVTIGGVSVGDHDLVRPALERAGVSLDFWKVAIKPGKPLVFGRTGSTLVLGLPGNPVSAQVTFCLFGLPLLKRMQGVLCVAPVTRSLRLTAALRQATGRRGFHRVTISGDTATPLSGQSSGSVASMAWADGLAIVSEHLDGIAAGQTVEVIALADL
jgi:molybdopterin molybdotransferase